MKRILLPCLVILCLSTMASAQTDSLNFYLPDSGSKDKKSKSESDSSGKSDKETESPKSESEVTERRSDVKEKVRPTKKSAPSESEKKSSTEKSPARDIKLRERKNSPDKAFDPPLDPYGMASAFENRWDFSSFIITPREELKFRLDAARSRTLRLARAFSALSAEVEIRQRNLNAAALAAYLLSRDQYSWVPLGGRSLTEAQMLAVKTTMRQDIEAMRSALSDYEMLRNSLNASAEEVAALEKNGLDAVPSGQLELSRRPTVPTATVAHVYTGSVIQERAVPVEVLKATLAVEKLSTMGDRRQSIASFAPPPPGGGIPSPPGSRVPDMPAAHVDKQQPRGESMKRPEKMTVVFETDVNAPVHAVRKGVVVYAGPFRGYGDMVVIEHEKGTFSVYSHLGTVLVRERQAVDGGTVLGRAGTPPELGRTGIHFQVRKGKDAIKPDDWVGEGKLQKLLTQG